MGMRMATKNFEPTCTINETTSESGSEDSAEEDGYEFEFEADVHHGVDIHDMACSQTDPTIQVETTAKAMPNRQEKVHRHMQQELSVQSVISYQGSAAERY